MPRLPAASSGIWDSSAQNPRYGERRLDWQTGQRRLDTCARKPRRKKEVHRAIRCVAFFPHHPFLYFFPCLSYHFYSTPSRWICANHTLCTDRSILHHIQCARNPRSKLQTLEPFCAHPPANRSPTISRHVVAQTQTPLTWSPTALMYAAQPNGADSATINPAALNSGGESPVVTASVP